MSSNNLNRRQILSLGGTALAAALAGCEDVDFEEPETGGTGGDEEQTGEETNENEQQYELPPVALLEGHPEPEDGTVRVDAIFEPATTPGDANIYFEDEILFELFVYTTFPVGNSVNPTKIAEKTSVPYNQYSTKIEVPFDEVPKNRGVRYRLKVTNNNTGESEWAMDQQVLYYIEYGDILIGSTTDGYTYIGDEEPETDSFTEQDNGDYINNFTGGGVLSADIDEAVPYSREAYKVENDLYDRDEGPEEEVYKGSQITVPEQDVELAEFYMDGEGTIGNLYDDFTFSQTVPSADFDYYGNEEYSVLDNHIYNEMAETMLEAQSDYGITNHYILIKEAQRMIQSNEYDALDDIGDAPVRPPEAYWTDPASNCVGHSFQLAWFLYHLGYTCATVWLDRNYSGNPSHLGVALPIPEDVLESDFPDDYPDIFTNYGDEYVYYIDQTSDTISDDVTPDTLGEHPWVYLEAASVELKMGRIPFTDVRQDSAYIRYPLEPEDNMFDTDILDGETSTQ